MVVSLFALRAGADLGAAGFVNVDDAEENQPTKVGAVTLSMTETRIRDSGNVYRSCKIEQLDVEVGDLLVKMQAFAVIFRRIQSFCVEHRAEHLAMAPIQGACWFSGLLRPAGFNLCGCERPGEHVGAVVELCVELPALPIQLPASIVEDSPMDDPAASESDETAATAVSSFRKELSAIVDQYRQLMHRMHNEVKTLELQQVSTSRRVFPSTDNSIEPVDEQRGPCHSSGKDFTAPFSIGQPRASSPIENTSLASLRGNTISTAGSTLLDKSYANDPAVALWREPPLRAALRSNVVHQGKKFEVACSSFDLTDKLAKEVANEQANAAGRRPKQEVGVAVEGNTLGEPSLPHYQAIVKIEPSEEQSPYETRNQRTITSRPEAKAIGAGLPQATKMDGLKATKATADRRPEKEIYKPPGAMISSGGRDTRVATKEAVKVKDSDMEEPSKRHAESRGGFRILGNSRNSDRHKEAFSSSRSAMGPESSMLPGRSHRRPYSPGSDADDQTIGRGLKRARTGKYNDQAGR